MKKLLIYLALAFSLVTLAACGKNEAAKPTSSTNNHQSKVQGQVTLILKTEKESKKKSVEFKKGDTVLDVLKEIYPVQENDGFITEIDGIQLMSAILIISEIGVDMTQFETDKQLCSWAGVSPANNESAGKKKSVRISKAGQYLKPVLIQCALAAIKNKNSYFGQKYMRIKKRRGHKKAIIAIARMMLVSIYHMILTGEKFNPSDYESFKNPKQRKEKNNYTVETALDFLKSQGFDVSSIQEIPK